VDIQNHSDSYWQLFDNPQLHSLISQGFTTLAVGNCGASLAPLLSKEALLSIQKWHNLEGSNINWQSFEEFLSELSRHSYACNLASLVGYSTLRRGIIGDAIRGLEKDELEALKRALKESLKAGAFGLSSGLSYSHEIIISELELYELAKIVAEKDALFSIHLRSEGSEVLEAVEEALDISRSTGARLKISHLKVRNETNWDKLPEILERIENAYHRGTPVHFDVYPYDTIWQVLYSYLPKWAVEGGRAGMLKHLKDPVQRNKILTHLNNIPVKLPALFIASTSNKLNFAGKNLAQLAKNLETSSEQALLHILENGGSEILVFEQNLDSRQVEKLVLHPLSLLATDGGGFGDRGEKLVHPRCFGTAQKIFKDYVKAGKLPVEEAVRKLTLAPAQKLGLKNRGQIKVGNFADLVILDLDKIADRATYENPYQLGTGVEYVFVNGQAAVWDSQLSGKLPGQVLRKE
jgi:N-acyl-D-amino-acid deacylase